MEADTSLRPAVTLEPPVRPGLPVRAAVAALAPVWLATVSVLGGVALLAVGYGIPVRTLTSDPGTVTHSPLYVGAVSNLGVLAWAAAATLSLFTFTLLRAVGSRSLETRFFRDAGLLTAWLACDDLYRLHDTVLPYRVGIPKPVVLAGYALVTLALLLRHRAIIRSSPFPILALACVCFALSLAVDALAGAGERLLLLEDGAKLFGIVTWLTYFGHTSVGVLKSRMARRPAAEGSSVAAPR